MVPPESLRSEVALKDTLILSSVNSTTINDSHLEPGCDWITMRKTGFIVSPVLVVKVEGLWSVGENISAKLTSEFWISLGGLLLEVPSFQSVLPLLNLFPLRIRCSLHFYDKLF